jgi:hypothetical protein
MPTRPGRTSLAAVAMALVSLGGDEPEGLRMSKPVVVAKVHGFGSFEPVPDATLTPDDKLMVYCEPSGHAIEKTEDGYRALLAQDARLRRKGSKEVVWEKAPLFEYEVKDQAPPRALFMRTDMAIKALAPGEYELDLTVRDRLKKDAKATRTVGFTVVRAKEDGDRAETEPPKKEAPKKRARR